MADTSDAYYYIPVKGRVEVGGKSFSLLSFRVGYAVDGLPEASVELPIGRAMSGRKEGSISSAEGFLSTLEPYTPFNVYLTINPYKGRAAPAGKNPGFPINKEFLVFKGWAGMPGMSKSFDSSSSSLTLKGFGEVGALAGVTQYINGIAMPSIKSTGPAIMTMSGANPAVDIFGWVKNNAAASISDLWVGIRSIIEAIGGKESAFIAGTSASGGQAFVNQILPRINAGKAMPKVSLNIGALIKNLPSTAKTNIERNVAAAITKAFYSLSGKIEAEGDIWNAIQSLGDWFFFNYIPGVEEDAIVSLVPTLKSTFSSADTIDPSEYFTFSSSRRYSVREYAEVSSVGLVAEAGHSGPWQDSAPPSKIIGSFNVNTLIAKQSGKQVRGRLLLREAPIWALCSGANASESLSKGNAVPDKGNVEAQTDTPKQGEAEKAILDSVIGANIANMYLRGSLFGSRSLGISGRFRMDICPGSQVKIVTPGERFTNKQDTLYGMVQAVSLVGGIGQGGVGAMATELNVRYVRSQSEQDTFGTTEHPLYTGAAWKGGKLLNF